MTRSRTIDAEAAVAGDMPRANHLATASPSDLSEFEALNLRQGAKCQFRVLLDGLGSEDRSNLDAALLTPRIQNTAIVRWMADRGITTSKTTVTRHRPVDGRPIECVTCRT